MKTHLWLAALAAVVVAHAGPGLAQEAPLAPSRAPVVADKAAAASAAPKATLYGYVNVQYARTDALGAGRDSASLEARRARIGVRGDVTPQIGYAVLFEGVDGTVKDAYGQLKNLYVPGLELRVGQWKTPFGYEQPESDTKLLWVNGSYVVQALARSSTTAKATDAPDARNLGAGLIGKWPVAGPVRAELAASYVNGAGPSRKDDLDEKDFWGRAGLAVKVAAATVRAGGSYGYGRRLADLGANKEFDKLGVAPVDDTSFYFQTYGADVTVDSPFFFAAVEVIQSERDVTAYAAGVPSRKGLTARGWYAGIYGKTPWNVGPIFRAEEYDANLNATRDVNERYTVGAYVDVLPVNARFIVNYEFDESARAVRTGNRAILFGQVAF